jgi:hypothetical protein
VRFQNSPLMNAVDRKSRGMQRHVSSRTLPGPYTEQNSLRYIQIFFDEKGARCAIHISKSGLQLNYETAESNI